MTTPFISIPTFKPQPQTPPQGGGSPASGNLFSPKSKITIRQVGTPQLDGPPPPNVAVTGPVSGMLKPGNINLYHRPTVHNADGSISTVRSITVTDDKGHAYLIPTVVGHKVVSDQEAVHHWQKTGQHLGVFSDEASADAYARTLHDSQAADYLPRSREIAQQAQAYAQQQAIHRAAVENAGLISTHGIVSPVASRAAAAHQVVNVESAVPIPHYTDAKRYTPHFTGEPIAGYEPIAPAGANDTSRINYRPYYTDAHTAKAMPKVGTALQSALGSTNDQPTLQQVYKDNHPLGQAVIAGLASSIPGVATAKKLAAGESPTAGTAETEAMNILGFTGGGEIDALKAGLGALRSGKSISEAVQVTRDAARASRAARVSSILQDEHVDPRVKEAVAEAHAAPNPDAFIQKDNPLLDSISEAQGKPLTAGASAHNETVLHPAPAPDTRIVSIGRSQRLGELVDANDRPIEADDWITLYHGTTPEQAAVIRANGFRRGAKPKNQPTVVEHQAVADMLGKKIGDALDYEPGRGIGDGVYLTADPERARQVYGSEVIPVRVRLSELSVPPERAGFRNETPEHSLLMDDGYVAGDIPASRIVHAQESPVRRAKVDILADPSSWVERDGGRFLTPEAARELDAGTNIEGNLSAVPQQSVRPAAQDKHIVETSAEKSDFPSHWNEKTAQYAEEHGLDPAEVPPTGEGGRVLKQNVDAEFFRQSPNDKKVQQGLRGARAARKQQDAGYSAERAARFARAEAIMHDTSLDPIERHIQAKAQLRGELPKINWNGFTELDENALSEMVRTIQEDPHLLAGQRIRAADALQGAVNGKVPTPSELTLIEHIFGKAEVANGLREISVHPLRGALMSILNIPRSIMSSADLSAPFRQGIVAGARHPAMFAKNFGPMLKAMKSPEYHAATESLIKNDPDYPRALAGGLRLTDFENVREERFPSNAAEKLNLRSIPGPLKGKKYATGPGDVVAASGRAYVTFLNKMRMDMFKYHLRMAQQQGRVVTDPAFLRDLSEVINSATGAGGGGKKFEASAAALNTFLFSPRLLKSRLNFLNPFWYKGLDRYARRLAMRSFFQFGAEATAFVGMLSLVPGVKIVTDPRNPDWGKVKVGNTRFDIGGGFQQPIRLAAQIWTAVAISSTTGRKLSLTAGGFGKPTRLDLFIRFFEGKESPIASLVTDKLRGTNQVGQPFKWSSALYQRTVPLLAQDAYDLYNSKQGGVNGIAAAAAGYGIGTFGFGIQTYGPTPPGQKAVSQLQKDAKAAGFGVVPHEFLIDLGHMKGLDTISAQNPKNPNAKLQAAIAYYTKETGDTSYNALLDQKLPDATAENYYLSIRHVMVGPGLAQYEANVKRVLDAEKAAK